MKRLVSFDFDDTMFFTPKNIEGSKHWEKVTGNVWPYEGWWGKAESLDTDVFHIPINPFVYKKYLEELSLDSHVFLATGRLEHVNRMRENVEKILYNYNLAFTKFEPLNVVTTKKGQVVTRNGVYLNTGGDTYRFKKSLFEKLIERIKPDVFVMYDDRHEHLVNFEEWAVTQPCIVEIIDVTKSDKTPKIF